MASPPASCRVPLELCPSNPLLPTVPGSRLWGTGVVLRYLSILLIAGLAGCTKYQPLEWHGEGSWSDARAAALARQAALDEVRSRADGRDGEPAAAASDGLRHRVVPGDTLSGIALRYGVPLATLAHVNAIRPPFQVMAGQVLDVPRSGGARSGDADGSAAPAAEPASRLSIASLELATVPGPAGDDSAAAAAAGAAMSMSGEQLQKARAAASQTPPALSGDGFVWPARGRVISRFGEKPNGIRNAGIDIAATEGAPVLAAENGIVVYAGEEIPGYGRMLLVRHAGNFTSAYAHNSELLVRVGDVVGRGQPIAVMGATGSVPSPRLHFELRAGRQPVDPLPHLKHGPTQLASRR